MKFPTSSKQQLLHQIYETNFTSSTKIRRGMWTCYLCLSCSRISPMFGRKLLVLVRNIKLYSSDVIYKCLVSNRSFKTTDIKLWSCNNNNDNNKVSTNQLQLPETRMHSKQAMESVKKKFVCQWVVGKNSSTLALKCEIWEKVKLDAETFVPIDSS